MGGEVRRVRMRGEKKKQNIRGKGKKEKERECVCVVCGWVGKSWKIVWKREREYSVDGVLPRVLQSTQT